MEFALLTSKIKQWNRPRKPLNLDYLLKAARTTTPNSRSRQKLCIYLHKLALFASVEGAEAIQKLSGNYSTKSVQPRTLPKDKLIVECRQSIKTQDWQWLYGMLAVLIVNPQLQVPLLRFCLLVA